MSSPLKFIRFRCLFALCIVLSQSVAAEDCPGNAPKRHTPPGYDFTTTSRVFHDYNVENFVTCVQNDSAKDLWFDWYVPGPNGYVPPGEILESPRTFTTDDVESFSSCLEYGNLADTRREQFLGHASDAAAVEWEAERDCRHWAKRSSAQYDADTEIEEVSVPIRVFFPSDSSSPEKTMLTLQGRAVLYRTLSPGGIELSVSSVEYDVKRYGERPDGDPSDVKLVPVEGGPGGDAFIAAFQEQIAMPDGRNGGLDLSDEGEIVLEMKYSPASVLTNVRYGLFDQSDKFVGSFFVPIFVQSSDSQ